MIKAGLVRSAGFSNKIVWSCLDKLSVFRAFDHRSHYNNITPTMANVIPDYDYLFKFLLLGSHNAGKTKLYNRYTEGYYTEVNIIIGLNFVSCHSKESLLTEILKPKINVIQSPDTSKIIKFIIWDTVTQERFKTINASYYRAAHGIIVCFDCTDRESSFKKVPALFDEIDQLANKNVQKILVATKIDLVDQRQVSHEEAKQLADQIGVPYIETSAKNNININEAILTLTRNVERVVEKEPKRSVESAPQSSPTTRSRCLIL